MTLEEFVAEAKAEIERFAAKWREEHKANPEHWPMEMDPGEWDEQLRAETVA